MNKLNSLGIIGLGTMGSALSENILNNEISLSVFNRYNANEKMVIKNFINKNKKFKYLKGFHNLSQFIKPSTTIFIAHFSPV